MEIKKTKKKIQKQPDYIIQQPMPLEEQEVDDMDQVIDDDMIKDIQKINVKKVTSTKEKIRRVQEFKFRILDLVSILIDKTKNPEEFTKIMPSLAAIISKLQKDKTHQQYLQRIVKVLVNYLNKKQQLTEEKLDDFGLCVQDILKSIAKCSNRQLNSQFALLYELLLKTIVQLGKSGRIIAATSIKEMMTMYSLKKDCQITEKLVKRILSAHQFTASKIFNNLCELISFESALKDKKRPEILVFMIKNPKLVSVIYSEKHFTKSIGILKQTISEMIPNIEKQSIQKIALMKRMLLVITKSEQYIKAQGKDFGDEFKILLQNFNSEDVNLISLKKNYLKDSQ